MTCYYPENSIFNFLSYVLSENNKSLLSYNIAKFLVPILKSLTTNDYTPKNTFEFSRDILNQNSNLFMASLDVDSLFTNIPLDETINIIIEKLFSENGTVHNLNKDQFKCLLT